jgi:hypothetical protein
MLDEVKRITTAGVDPSRTHLWVPPKSGAYLLPEIRFRIAYSFAAWDGCHSLLVDRLTNTSTSAVCTVAKTCDSGPYCRISDVHAGPWNNGHADASAVIHHQAPHFLGAHATWPDFGDGEEWDGLRADIPPHRPNWLNDHHPRGR